MGNIKSKNKRRGQQQVATRGGGGKSAGKIDTNAVSASIGGESDNTVQKSPRVIVSSGSSPVVSAEKKVEEKESRKQNRVKDKAASGSGRLSKTLGAKKRSSYTPGSARDEERLPVAESSGRGGGGDPTVLHFVEPQADESESQEASTYDEVSSSEEAGGMDVGDDFVGSGTFDEDETAISGRPDIRCLAGEQEILREKERTVRELGEVLNVSASAAFQLLRHFRWNKDRLLSAYIEDPVKTCREAGVITGSSSGKNSSNNTSTSNSTSTSNGPHQQAASTVVSGSCSICGEDLEPESSTALPSCGHRFCDTCWRTFLAMKINEGETLLCCAAAKCGMPVEDDMLRRLVDAETYEKYMRFTAKSFVEQNPTARWCPRPGCGNAIEVVDATRGAAITCACGYRFCYTCNEEAHAPASCEQVKAWQRKCRDDSETLNWLQVNTQQCPKCQSPIEKNGGCNHMTCRQCQHEYCWVCRKDWKGHNDFYTCNKFKKSQKGGGGIGSALLSPEKQERRDRKRSAKEREALEREQHRLALEKYLHYYQRYMNHERSRQFELRLREEARQKMRELQQGEATALGVQFIAKAAEQLLLCRSTLRYSYVLGYYLGDGPAKLLFEYLQTLLEQTTEELSHQVSQPAEALSSDKSRQALQNLTRLAESRLHSLLTAVEQGLTQTTEAMIDM
jgi:ariadne-1